MFAFVVTRKGTDKDGMNALMQFCALSENDKIVEIAQLLIAKGVDVKQTDKDENNALMLLCSQSCWWRFNNTFVVCNIAFSFCSFTTFGGW